MTTAEKVIEIRSSSPCLTLKQIGDKVGVSRERVRQILDREGLPTRHYSGSKLIYKCLNCGDVIKNPNTSFCSTQCRCQYSQIPVACTQCGNIFYRYKSQITGHRNQPRYKTHQMFCSRACFGKYIGTHYHRGSKKTYENIRDLPTPHKPKLLNWIKKLLNK